MPGEVSALCSNATLYRAVSGALHNGGVRTTENARVQVLIDYPVGWALQRVEGARALDCVVATDNPCPEYRLVLLDHAVRQILPLHPFNELAQRLVYADENRQQGSPSPMSALTPTERAVLHYAALGMRNREIGAVRGVSVGTVKNVLSRVYLKLGISGRVDASNYYFGRWHLVRSAPDATMESA